MKYYEKCGTNTPPEDMPLEIEKPNYKYYFISFDIYTNKEWLCRGNGFTRVNGLLNIKEAEESLKEELNKSSVVIISFIELTKEVYEINL